MNIDPHSLKVDNVHTNNPPVISDSSCLIKAKVAGVDIEFMIDSGAQVNTVTKLSFSKIVADELASSKILALSSNTDQPLKG